MNRWRLCCLDLPDTTQQLGHSFELTPTSAPPTRTRLHLQ